MDVLQFLFTHVTESNYFGIHMINIHSVVTLIGTPVPLLIDAIITWQQSRAMHKIMHIEVKNLT